MVIFLNIDQHFVKFSFYETQKSSKSSTRTNHSSGDYFGSWAVLLHHKLYHTPPTNVSWYPRHAAIYITYRMLGISNIGWLDRPRCLLEFSKHANPRSNMPESTKVWKVHSPTEWSIVFTACRVRHLILGFAKFHYISKFKNSYFFFDLRIFTCSDTVISS